MPMPMDEELNIEEPQNDFDSAEDITSSFQSRFTERCNIKIQKSFPLFMTSSDQSLCLVTDRGVIHTFTLDTLSKVNIVENAHDAAVTGLTTWETEPNIVVTSSIDKTVKVWDLRQTSNAQKSVQTIKFSGETAKKAGHDGKARPFSCVDVSNTGEIAVGTEQLGGEAYLLLWDIRASNKLSRGFWDTHNDDITSIKFNKEKTNLLATGSTDGQVNVLDLSMSDEDEALYTSHNTESSVNKLVWYTKKKNATQLAIHTHTEEIQLWDIDSVGPHTSLTRENICHGIRRSISEHTYVAGIHPASEHEDTGGGLVVFAGSNCPVDPCLRLAKIRNRKAKPMGLLGQNKGLVRSTVVYSDICITGCEEGYVRILKETKNNVGEYNDTGKISQVKSNHRTKPY